jgi:Na+-driven multidrug efflux pump
VAPPLAAMCQLRGAGAAACVQYVRGIALGVPANAVVLVGSMALHGGGETLRPSLITLAVGILNVPLSWLLSGAQIAGLPNPLGLDLHVLGIALGTSLSWTLGAVMTAAVLLRGVKDLRLRRSELAPDRVMMRRVVRIGVPNFFEGLSLWAVNLLVLIIIGMVGPAALWGPHRGAVSFSTALSTSAADGASRHPEPASPR